MKEPATPLPWDFDTNDPPGLVDGHGWFPSDSEYVVHAANAYPRLMEALEQLALAFPSYYGDEPQLIAARALLDELS